MAKTHTTLTLDSEVLEQAKALNINISGALNEYLSSLIAKYDEDIEGINIRLERIQLEKALKKQGHWQGIVKQCQAKIEKWEELEKRKEEEQLKREKEEIENSKKCINCGNILEGLLVDKAKNFKAGIVCQSCYLKMSGDDYKKWTKI